MKPKTTIMLIVILLACVVYVVVRHTDLFTRGTTSQKPTKRDRLVFGAESKGIEKLTVTSADGSVLSFAKEDGAWRIVEPVEAKADSYAVTSIAHELKALKYERVFPADGPGAVGDDITGLDAPQWTVSFVDSAGTARLLHIGRAVPLGGGERTYVRPGPRPGGADKPQTYEVAVDFARKLDRPLSEFRSKALLELTSDDIVRIIVQGRQSYELKKRDGRWGIVHPISAAANKEKVRKFIEKFKSLQAKRFIADAPKSLSPYGLAEPRLILTIRTQAPTPATASTSPATRAAGKSYALMLGSRSEKRIYAKFADAPGVFELAGSLLDDLQPDVTDLRDKRILDVEADEVVRAEMDLPAGKTRLVKQDDKWRMVEPFAGEAHGGSVRRLIRNLASLEGERFIDPVPSSSALGGYGLGPPRGRIALQIAGRSETVSLLIGAASGSGEMTFAKSASSPAVAVVRSAKVEPLLGGAAAYWGRTIFRLPQGARLQRLVLDRPAGRVELARGDDDAWSMVLPIEADVDKSNLTKVIDELSKLTARKIVFLGREVPASFTKAKEIITVQVSWSDEPASQPATAASAPATAPTRPAAATRPSVRTRRFRVVKILRKAYVWAIGEKVAAVGEMTGRFYDNLAAELRDRTISKFDPDAIQGIKITAGKDVLELRRRQDAWQCAGDAYVDIDAEKVASFLSDVAELKAEQFLTHKTSASDAAKFGMKDRWFTLELTPAEGDATEIVVSNKGPDKAKDRYASSSGAAGVFVLPTKAAQKMAKSLKDFKK